MTLAETAVRILLSHVGEEETAQNVGPIVTWAVERFTHHRPEDPLNGREGWAAWCAGSIGRAYLEATEELGLDPAPIHDAWSLECDTLWARHYSKGWAWLWSPTGPNARQPQAGDVIFLITQLGGKSRYHHTGEPDLRHVRLVTEVAGEVVRYVEGNGGNSVRLGEMRLASPALYGFSRVGG